MSNPIYAMFNNGMSGNNPMALISKFMEFRKNFSGNPQEEVQKIINSGRLSQDQINQAQNMAKQFQAIVNSMK